jgi:hypothetical protein
MNAILKHGSAIDRGEWLALLAHAPQAAIYVHPAYLDIVAPGWQAIELWRDRTLLAIMPLYLNQKAGYTYALQPSYCQFWGIIFAGEDLGNDYKTYSHRRKVVKAMVDAIPAHIKWFMYGFAPEFDYPLPFHWAGYTLQSRYTYRLDLTVGYPALEKNFGNDTRYDMRKALSQGFAVHATHEWQRLSGLVQANSIDGKLRLQPAQLETLDRIAPFLLQSQLGFLLEVVDADESLIGAALFASFAGKTTYLISSQAPGKPGNGAMSLLLARAIAEAAARTQVFDFEGSMIEGVESFFRGFGGRPVPYLMIEKNDLPLPIRWIRKLR